MFPADILGIYVVIGAICAKLRGLRVIYPDIVALQEVIGADRLVIVCPETGGRAAGGGVFMPVIDLAAVRIDPDNIIQLHEYRIEHHAFSRHSFMCKIKGFAFTGLVGIPAEEYMSFLDRFLISLIIQRIRKGFFVIELLCFRLAFKIECQRVLFRPVEEIDMVIVLPRDFRIRPGTILIAAIDQIISGNFCSQLRLRRKVGDNLQGRFFQVFLRKIMIHFIEAVADDLGFVSVCVGRGPGR